MIWKFVLLNKLAILQYTILNLQRLHWNIILISTATVIPYLPLLLETVVLKGENELQCTCTRNIGRLGFVAMATIIFNIQYAVL